MMFHVFSILAQHVSRSILKCESRPSSPASHAVASRALASTADENQFHKFQYAFQDGTLGYVDGVSDAIS